MSITDELREYAEKQIKWLDTSKVHYRKLFSIADRIDAEHENATSSAEQLLANAGQLLADVEKDRDYNYANWQECKQKVLQGNITFDELNARIERLEDELSHCIELPKDADGEYIHIGDELCGYGWQDGGMYCKAIVNECIILVGVADQKYSDWIMWDAGDTRHHHEPTVEDVLREFGDWYTHTKGGCDEDGIIADYAAKLQLAGDAAGPNELALAYHVGYDDALAKRKPDASKVMQR